MQLPLKRLLFKWGNISGRISSFLCQASILCNGHESPPLMDNFSLYESRVCERKSMNDLDPSTVLRSRPSPMGVGCWIFTSGLASEIDWWMCFYSSFKAASSFCMKREIPAPKIDCLEFYWPKGASCFFPFWRKHIQDKICFGKNE